MTTHIVHVVRWWLAEPADATASARFRSTVTPLAHLPGVLGLTIGTPTDIEWSGPDQTWHLGFVITFDSVAAVTAYMAHPAHAAVVALAGELVERVDVFYLDAAA